MITWLVQKIARLPVAHPKSVLVAALLLTAIAGIVIPKLEISTDRNLLAGKNDPSAKRRDEVNELFGTTLVAAVIIQGRDDAVEIQRATDELAEALSHNKDLVRDVFAKADIGFFERHALMFVPDENLKRLIQAISRGDVGLSVFEQSKDLPTLVSLWADRAEVASLPEDTDPKDVARSLDFFSKVVDDLSTWLSSTTDKPLDLIGKLWTEGPSMAGTADSSGYLADKDGLSPRLGVLFVQPTSTSQGMEAVAPFTDFIRQKAASVMAKHPGFKSYVTGMPALTTDEMRVVSHDCLVTGIISGIGVLLIFWLTFRSIRITLFAGLSLGVGIIWATGLAALVYGHLTMVSGYFAAQLFGLGVAYTIYIVTRFHEALLAGEDRAKAVQTAIAKAGPGVVGSSLTVAAAFGAVAFSDFRAFSELGVIAGLGIVLVLIANILVLPAALILAHPGVKAVRVSGQGSAFFGFLAKTPLSLAIIALVLFCVGLAAIPRIGFNYAVEDLLPRNSESVIGLRLLDKRTAFTTTYSMSITDSIEKAEQLRREFSKLPTVARAEALSMFVPEHQDKKKAVIASLRNTDKEAIKRAFDAMVNFEKTAGRSTAKDFAASMEKLKDILDDLSFDAVRAKRPEAVGLQSLVSKIERAQKAAASQTDDHRVQELERQLFTGIRRGLGVLKSGLSDRGFGPTDLPLAVQGRYVSQDGKTYAVIIFPKGDISDKAFFEKHVAEILSVDKGATGHPITHLAFTHLIHKGFAQAAILAAIAVIILILLDLRRPRDFGLAALPVVIGTGWFALIIALLGLKFNYANLMAIPILIGTGVDFGINLAHRARQEGSVRAAVRTTGKAIAVSGSAALIGFGSLILGQHWGVKSLGLMLVIGIASCLIISLTILPVLLERKK